MAVPALTLQNTNYLPGRGLIYQTHLRGNSLKYVDKLNDQARANASKAAFQTGLERALLNKKYWDDLLEKLRKMGGGGGSDLKFDRIAVSMQLMNFLSNKMVQALIENWNKEFLRLLNNLPNQIKNTTQNILLPALQNIGKVFFGGLTNIFLLIVHRDARQGRLYNMPQQMFAFIGILSFQLNKFKELLKGIDFKKGIKKIKKTIVDFFVEMKDEILYIAKVLNSFWQEIFSMFKITKNN